MSQTRPRPRPLSSLAGLASAGAVNRPGTASPGSHAPLISAPGPDGSRRRPRPSASRLRRSLAASTAEGLAAEVVTACAGGAATTAWALHLGAGPFLVGVLTSLPLLALVVHLPAAWITARLGRRRVALWAVALSRQAFLPLVALPFVPIAPSARLWVLIAVASVSAVLAVIGNNAWVSWMGDLVPERVRGRYFARRTAFCTAGGTLAALGAGLWIDHAGSDGRTGLVLALLAALACAAGAVAALLMSLQHDVPAQPVAPKLASYAQPFRDRNARAFLSYQVSWNLGVGVAGPFFAVHMLQNLKMGFALMAAHSAATALVRVLSVRLWGKAIDRVGAKPVLVACSYAISAIPLIWLFPSPSFLWPVALDAVVSGLLWSGHGLAMFALPLGVAPRGERPFYLAAFSAAGGLAFAAAAALGGVLAESLPADLLVLGRPMFGMQVVFVLSSVIRLLAATRAAAIAEARAGSASALARFFRQSASDALARVRARV